MRANLAVARAHAAQARVWAVVKADAYGHGLANAVQAFARADGLALVETEAALRLRQLGWSKPILLLEGVFEPEDWPAMQAAGVCCVVHTQEQIAMLEHARLDGPVDICLKINSGMNRLGFAPAGFGAVHARLRANPKVGAIGFATHFANADHADNPDLPMQEQVRRVRLALQGLHGEISLSNSAATLLAPELAADWVRPGIMLYGASPGGGSAQEFGLLPGMTLESQLIAVQQLARGDAVGYGSRFVAPAPMRIGVVACGYADGYPRHAPNGAPILVDGIRTVVLGTVSMDMLTVDLTPVPQARVGSRVVLWGEGLPIDEVAQAAGTLGYELMCALTPRVRVEVKNGQPQGLEIHGNQE